MSFLRLQDQALLDAKLQIQHDYDLMSRDTLLDDRARLVAAETRARREGFPSTSLVMRVLCDVAHALAGRLKAELDAQFTSGGERVCEAIVALRAACDSDNRVDGDVVSRIVCDEATVDELPTKLMLPQPGYPVDSCYQNWQPPEDTLAAVQSLFIEAPQIVHAPDESLRPQLGHRDSARVPSAEDAQLQLPAEDTVDTVVSDASKLGHGTDESPSPASGVPFFVDAMHARRG